MTTGRIQVLLRDQVNALVKELSDETGLTLSKTCAMLVEEALEARGLYDTRLLRGKQKQIQIEDEKPLGMADIIREAVAHSDKRSQLVSRKTETIDDSDLELLTKLKKLKALEEAGLL
jgi:hypothetical protein